MQEPPRPRPGAALSQPPRTGRGSPAYRGVLRGGASVTEVYEFIDAEYATREKAPAVTQMCAWLELSKSGFYDWKSRPESVTAKRQERLRLIIRRIFDDSDGTYGYRRIAWQLARQGTTAGPELVRK